jgi:cell division GTPase FtsZ
VLLQAVRGISELVTVHGLINLDFADVRSIMAEMGLAMMGAASATGENRAVEAAQRAISSPLLEDLSIKGARGLLINVTGGPDLSLYEVNEAASLIQEEAHEDANIIFGAVIDEHLSDELRVTVIATGFGDLETRYASRTVVTSPLTAPLTPPQAPIQTPAHSAITAPVQSAATRPIESPADPSTPTQVKMFPSKPVRRLGLIVDESLDIPTFKRRSQEAGHRTVNLEPNNQVDSNDDLDIPTFLRKHD